MDVNYVEDRDNARMAFKIDSVSDSSHNRHFSLLD